MKNMCMKVSDLLGLGMNVTKKGCKKLTKAANKAVVALAAMLTMSLGANAQSFSGTDYTAGTTALETVATQVAAYVPYVVNLCYAIAGVVAIVGAISVYIAMNNEEQDVKNILVLQNWLERIRKEVTNKVLSIKRISDFLNFPILAQPTLKKI